MNTRMAAGMIVQITSSRWLPWKYWAARTGRPSASFSIHEPIGDPDQDHLRPDEDDPGDDQDDQEQAVDFPAEGRDDVVVIAGRIGQPPVGRERGIEKRPHAEDGGQGKQDTPVTHGNAP